MSNPFREWLAEVSKDAVVIRPDNIGAEASGNLWTFSLSPEQVTVVSVADVEEFAAGVAGGRRTWLSAHRADPMVLYRWHDEQTGQLRFSLVSASHGRLPFTCEVVPAASLAAVVSTWLGSRHLHGIPWSELHPLASCEADPNSTSLVLPVWSSQVP